MQDDNPIGRQCPDGDNALWGDNASYSDDVSWGDNVPRVMMLCRVLIPHTVTMPRGVMMPQGLHAVGLMWPPARSTLATCPWAALPDAPSMWVQSSPCSSDWALGEPSATWPGPHHVPKGVSWDPCVLVDSRGRWQRSACPGTDTPALAATPTWRHPHTHGCQPSGREQRSSSHPRDTPGTPHERG